MKKYLSDYMEAYLDSISYELTDSQRAMLIMHVSDNREMKDRLMELANITNDKELKDRIFKHYEFQDFAKRIFESNDGSYIYLLTDEDEITACFLALKNALQYAWNTLGMTEVLIEKHKIASADNNPNEVNSIFEYVKGQEPEARILGTDIIYSKEMEAQFMASKLPYKLNQKIPIPFQKGDIVRFDFWCGEKRIGVIESDLERKGYDWSDIVLYIDEDGNVCTHMFYPYTAEIIDHHYDRRRWDKLVEISKFLRGEATLSHMMRKLGYWD